MPGLRYPPAITREQIRDLVKVALGEAAADLAIVNGDVVNVYTREVLPGNAVLIKGDRIAYVGKDASRSIGRSTQVIDAAGKTVIPGLIDGHTHIDSVYSMSEVLRYAIKGGTTTIISEASVFVFPLGYRGIIEFLRSARNQPIKVFATVPAMVTISPSAEEHAITTKEVRRLLRRGDVAGLGEAYWAPVVAGNQRVLDFIIETIKAGKCVEGHTSGAKGNKLQACVASGMSSCHEPITMEEVMERLRLGLFVLLREGEVRRELEAVSRLKDENIDFSLLGLASDGLGPWQFVKYGYMEALVQKAIDVGFDPILAVQMVTINVARHFRLDHLVGGIAPGRYADIVIVPDRRTIRAEYVISNGRLVAKDGQVLVAPRKHAYAKFTKAGIPLPRDFTAGDFAIPVVGRRQGAKVRIIDLVSSLVTRETVVDMPVSNGMLSIDVAADLLKVAAIEWTHQPGKTFVGFIRGLMMKRGAIASSYAWDLPDLISVGASESDMAQAVNRVRELKGGIVVCVDGKILTEVPLPVGGLISEEPMETIALELERLQRVAADLGFPYPDVRLTLGVLTTPAIAFLRICEDGLFNLARNSFVDLVVD